MLRLIIIIINASILQPKVRQYYMSQLNTGITDMESYMESSHDQLWKWWLK